VDIEHLRNFALLAAELHFSRTADSLGISQSTLSSQVVSLEHTLDAKLFERSRRRVQLTAAGAILLENIRPVLEQLDDIRLRVREAGRGERATLVVGASKPAINSRLPDMLRTFQKQQPNVLLRVRVSGGFSDAVMDDLIKHRVDLAFARAGRVAKGIASRTLWSLPYSVILPAGHEAASGRVVKLNRLSGETLFSYPRRLIGASYDEQIAFCRQLGFVPKAVEEIEDSDAIVALVSCGLGVSITPLVNIEMSPRVVSRQIASTSWKYRVAVFWRTAGESATAKQLLRVAAAHQGTVRPR
jgi:DNA-binding transcriptional LysR family regulator